jgi:hypothetical protein
MVQILRDFRCKTYITKMPHCQYVFLFFFSAKKKNNTKQRFIDDVRRLPDKVFSHDIQCQRGAPGKKPPNAQMSHVQTIYSTVKILENNRKKLTVRLENSQNLVTSDNLDLGNTMRVTKKNTNLGGSKTLTSVLDNLLNDRVGSKLQPAGSLARVGGSR